ncbi:tRNA glutamyl-Q(34) synthetase GluQRS [Falsihalocynthiibacter arcticus]|uniref:Glutamyl-Q tRNA(Asp) synthetase n=1 Tax=Falsihalocynthiibacter arcticus TaxID=1579316 RepID=A0A126V365_9RHOB|nr:tRNA glutamyl-Q(34) synthetase GluQRS [Falsihalocynthiibacter arcticus]AML52762.1 glutamyl-Q tRNA(Asp) synthetase [Falsihalocynthiibacter arcticus]
MITRFAPSPTGPLHLGHAYSALLAYDMAMMNGGEFLLRIEDIDQSRARPHWETQIYEDLDWLGLWWPRPVVLQSEQMSRYETALDTLWRAERLYPCHCSRRDIQDAMSAPQEGTQRLGPDGTIYPGTCTDLPKAHYGEKPRPSAQTLRLRMRSVARLAEKTAKGTGFSFIETGEGPNGETGEIFFSVDELITEVGDIVLARKGMGTSYHLSVVLDDAAQEVSHVIRGQDLFEATKIHVVLQKLLGLPSPSYHHHKLIRDDDGKRLAKRDDARAIAKFRADGKSPEDIRAMVGL